jgi:nitrogen fixation NifU-like protein
VTAFRAVVLEHFRHPRNRGALPLANASAEGVNALCGDRVRVQLVIRDNAVREARFTADACAICIAAASLLTEAVCGLSPDAAVKLDLSWLYRALDGEPPDGRKKCASLPLDTLRRALAREQDVT